ncbi:MAG: cell division protein FtsZ [Rhizobiales bacterium]|nr:cell division protein FtsZ [Hyphomicrobiales bacterium]NRB13989.1 cell division protein FtsZ [Hyphomicrobiales bacterium]
MSLNIQMPELRELKPRITVFGVGGAGGNAVNNMAEQGLEGVEFVVANTDAQALRQSKVERQIQLGTMITEGLGAGSRPEIGAAAAEDSLPDIADCMEGSHMCFITAGMGGGTGTGAAPVIARCARELDILTVGVVTKPFQFEGQRRMDIAEQGIAELELHVDTLIVIPNQNLFRIANENTTFSDAFAMADQVLMSGVSGITDLMVKEGLINLDFADVRSIMKDMGKAMMGTGEATGEKRAVEAAEAAISNPLLDDVSMKGAKGLLIAITGGDDLTLYEIDEAASRIRSEVDPEANIILGTTTDNTLDGIMRVSVVATGIDKEDALLAMDNSASNGYQRPVPAQPAAEKSADPAPATETAELKPHAENIEVRRLTASDAVGKAGVRLEQSETHDVASGNVAPKAFEPQRPATVHPSTNSHIGVNKQAMQPQMKRLSEQEQSRVAGNLGNNTPRANLAQQSPAHALRTDDFPPVAQREIRQSYENKRRETEVAPADSSQNVDQTTKRNSFFDRLANVGLGRKDNNLVEGAQNRSQEARTAEPMAKPLVRRPEPKPFEKTAENTDEQPNLEIPAFLRRQNN